MNDVAGHVSKSNFNPLAAEFFLLPSNWHGDNVLHTFTWHGVFFHAYCLARTFFFGTHVPMLRIKALPLSTVQGKCIYTNFNAQNQET